MHRLPGRAGQLQLLLTSNACHAIEMFLLIDYNREVKHDVNGRWQTAKATSDFEFFSSNP